MFVEDVMKRKVITATPDQTVLEALKTTKINRIRHLPVVEGDKLVGIVSDRDLRSVSPSVLASMDMHLLENTLVKDIMHTEMVTIPPSEPVEDAARLLYEHRIGCLPVVDEKMRLLGIVTDGDILFCFVEMYHM